MANLTSSSIATGGTIEASHITALYDVLTGAATYDNISVAGTASIATSAVSASHAVTSSYAVTASYATNAGGATINTGSFYVSSSVVGATITFKQGDNTTEAVTVNNVTNATSASYALTASYAANAGGTTINTGSFYVSSSVVGATITFKQGDNTTEAVTVNNVTNATSASYAVTASYVKNAVSASKASSASTADTALTSNTTLGTQVEFDSNRGGTNVGTFSTIAGVATLSAGTVTITTFSGPLNDKVLGTDCFITVTPLGETSGSLVVSLNSGNITIDDYAGLSGPSVNFIGLYAQ